MKGVVQNEFLKSIFQPTVTFVKESQFYSSIVASLEQFEEELNIPESDRMDMFFKLIGSRLSLDESNEFYLNEIRV